MIDPAFDPEAFREEGHRLIDQLADYLQRATRADLPVLPWKPPAEMIPAWSSSFPADPPADPGAVFSEIIARVIAGSNHLHHPRYIGHQVSAPLPMAALADLCSALFNQGMAVYEMGMAGAAIERAVLRFFAGRLGFGEGAGGVLTSGGSVGNLTALLAARQAKAGRDVWTEGEGSGPKLAVLGSKQAHYSVERAVKIMGWGEGGFVAVPVDAAYRLRPEALGPAMDRAEAEGRKVIAVVASACSTATGAFDPIPEIASFCEDRGIWLHVDGAHGASAALSSRYRGLVAGIERADSVVWDAHKMMLVPALATAVIFRHRSRSAEAFAQEASYLFDGDGRRAGEEADIGPRTLECTKRMLGLPVYAALSSRGTHFFDDYVTRCFDLARRFADRLATATDFEVPVPPACNIVCFRYTPDNIGDAALDGIQAEVRRRLVESGAFYLVQTRLGDRTFLRITIVNPLTGDADLDALVYRIREVAAEILGRGATAPSR